MERQNLHVLYKIGNATGEEVICLPEEELLKDRK